MFATSEKKQAILHELTFNRLAYTYPGHYICTTCTLKSVVEFSYSKKTEEKNKTNQNAVVLRSSRGWEHPRFDSDLKRIIYWGTRRATVQQLPRQNFILERREVASTFSPPELTTQSKDENERTCIPVHTIINITAYNVNMYIHAWSYSGNDRCI